jgi:3-hydroxyisobutyrate dehydrogenase-like beta-hydroxyacid dehydrogenase
MTMKKVGVIGVGAMGAPMAINIHKAGFELVVCDRSPQARATFKALGVCTTESAADCADCDAVIVLVATPEQAETVVLGPDGLVSRLEGHRPLLVFMGTVSPDTVISIEAKVASRGVRVVDAPVSGGVVNARTGTLAIMMGGRREDCDRLRPLMEAMGRKIFYCGHLGAGQATKIVNNIIGITNLMTAAEAYRIALDNGLILSDALAVLEAGTGRNFFTSEGSDAIQTFAVSTATREDFDSLLAILKKDIDLALSIGKSSGSLPAISSLRSVLADAGDETLETWRSVAAGVKKNG